MLKGSKHFPFQPLSLVFSKTPNRPNCCCPDAITDAMCRSLVPETGDQLEEKVASGCLKYDHCLLLYSFCLLLHFCTTRVVA